MHIERPSGNSFSQSIPTPVRKPYVHQEYPKALYHPSGRTATVRDAEQHAKIGEEWATTPYPEPMADPAAQAAPQCPNCAAMNERFNKAWDEIQAKYNSLKDENQKLTEQLAAAAKPEPNALELGKAARSREKALKQKEAGE